MNFKDLVAEVARTTRRSKRQTAPVVREVFRHMRDGINRGDDLSITNFGRFSIKKMAEKKGRDWSTGEPITIAPTRTIRFMPSRKMVRDARRATDKR